MVNTPKGAPHERVRNAEKGAAKVLARLARELADWKHARHAAQAEHQVQRGLLLDVVVGERAAVLQLLAREDEALLVGRDALLVLDLLLHVLDGVAEVVAEKA